MILNERSRWISIQSTTVGDEAFGLPVCLRQFCAGACYLVSDPVHCSECQYWDVQSLAVPPPAATRSGFLPVALSGGPYLRLLGHLAN